MATLLSEIKKFRGIEKPAPHIVNRNYELDEFFGFMAFFYLVPVLLLTFRILPLGSHNAIIVLMGLLMTSYVFEKGINLESLGVRKDNLLDSLCLTLPVTAAVGILLLFLKSQGLITTIGDEGVLFYAFYILISAPVQEFIFRGLIFYELGLFLGRKKYFFLRVLLSAVIFGFAHAFYHNWLVLLVTTAIGLVWGYIYYKKPNFYALALSHALLGAIAVYIGLV